MVFELLYIICDLSKLSLHQ